MARLFGAREISKPQNLATVPIPMDQSITWAAKQLSKKEPWKSLVQSNDPSEMLRQVYSKSKNKEFVGKIRLIFRLCEFVGDLDKWNEVVAACVNNTLPN